MSSCIPGPLLLPNQNPSGAGQNNFAVGNPSNTDDYKLDKSPDLPRLHCPHVGSVGCSLKITRVPNTSKANIITFVTWCH